jgi:hypothetical protein
MIQYINISYKHYDKLTSKFPRGTHSKNYTTEVARYKLELVCVQEFRWVKRDTVRSGDYFFYRKGNENHQLRR